MSAEPNPRVAPTQHAEDEVPLFPLLDDYWEALRRGDGTDPAGWLQMRADGPQSLPELHILAVLHEARRMLLDESDPEGLEPDTIDAAIDAPLLEAGTRLGECRIISLLGYGGMGEVYLAEHEALGRKVAIKVLPARLTGDTDAIQRFRKSVQILARLDPHPHIAHALHASQQEGRFYLVMEYVAGTDLRTLVRKSGPLPPAQACAIVRQVAAGLAYAHQHGIIHRDVKPSNLMQAPGGTVKILDLGLARLTPADARTGEASQTGIDAFVGTLDYIAPEQARAANQAGAASDLYSLGCTWYYLLAGRPPFEHRRHLEKLLAHAVEEPEPIRQIRPEVSERVATMVHRLLAKNPQDRFCSAADLITALDAIAEPTRLTKRRAAARDPIGPLRRHWLVAAAALLVAAFALGLLAYLLPSRALVLEQLQAEFWGGLPKRPECFGTHTLVLKGQDQPSEFPPAWHFDPSNGLRLEGHFSRPTYWYMVWIDTNGFVTVAGTATRDTNLSYPLAQNNIVRPSPDDPPGAHLLLLVAGPVPAESAASALQTQLEGLGKPPPVSWMGRLRGPEEVKVPHELTRAYLAQVYGRMPARFAPVYALFISTGP